MAAAENPPAPASTALDDVYDPDDVGLRDSEVVQENLDLLDTCPEDCFITFMMISVGE
jgi:hypothetical protein